MTDGQTDKQAIKSHNVVMALSVTNEQSIGMDDGTDRRTGGRCVGGQAGGQAVYYSLTLFNVTSGV